MDLMRKIGVSCNAALAHEAKDHAGDDGARGREAAPGCRFGGSGHEKAFRIRLSRISGGESASGAAKIRLAQDSNQEI